MGSRQPPRQQTTRASAAVRPQPRPDDVDDLDVWQAASLLVGLYGERALHVAAARVTELNEDAERDRRVWHRIIIRIGELLCAAPARSRN